MGYYADCRKYIKERNIDEIVKIDDNVLFNLAFGVNRHKGYFGQPLIGTLTSLMLKYSRVEDKILNMCKRKKYDIYKDHDFDLYRFRNGLFSPSDYSEDMIKYLFGGTGGINLTKVKEEKQELYAKHIIQNNIKESLFVVSSNDDLINKLLKNKSYYLINNYIKFIFDEIG